MLSREIATQMRGRALSWEIFPFSFREYLDYKAIDSTDPLSTKKRLTIQKAFEGYWETGGFPEVVGLDRRLRIKIHQLENLVFTALRRVSPDIHYFRTKSGLEVDFLARLPDRSRMLVQASESIAEIQTRKREVAALSEAMAELGLRSGMIVTRNDDEGIDVDGGKIEVVPAWRFLLNLAR
jgi:hypothetical protein